MNFSRIVITGATGHLGRHAVHLLASLGHLVVAASRTGKHPEAPYRCEPARAQLLAADLAAEESVEILAAALGGGAALVHLAAWHPPSGAASAADRRRLIEVNALGTMRAYEAARKAGVAAVVFASCAEVYGDTPDDPLTEGSRLRPRSDLAATKLTGEDHLCSLAAEERIRGVSLRFPLLYGPGEGPERAVPRMLQAAARGELPAAPGGLDVFDLLHVRDAALAIQRALEYGASGVFNVTGGEALAGDGVVRAAMAAVGAEPPPGPPGERRGRAMSGEQARRELGFVPRVALAEGLREALASWMTLA